MSFLTPLPPLFPRLTYRIPTSDNDQDPSYSIIPSIPASQNQNQRNRRNSQDNKYISDIDREEDALHAQNIRIAIHGQLYLRPPGLDPYVPPGYYTDQEQQGTPPQMDETFAQDEDEEGFVLSEEEEEGDEDEFEDELAEEEEQDLDAEIEPPSDASYLTLSPDATPNEGGVVYEGTFTGQDSPTTPSAGMRGTAVLEALSHLLDVVGSSRGDILPEDMMSLEEDDELSEDDLVGEDLDADVEDMDEDLESSFIEEDSMDL